MQEQQLQVSVQLIATTSWGDLVPEEVVEVAPPAGGAALVLPGPARRPVRPQMQVAVGPGGIAARVVRGDGKVLPSVLLVRLQMVQIPLSEPPLAVAARQDGGCWVQFSNSVAHIDPAGKKVLDVSVRGVFLVGAKDDAVWVVGLREAYYLTSTGQMSGPYAWNDGEGVLAEDALCAFTKKEPRRIQCLRPDGQRSARDVAAPVGPFERLQMILGDRMITRTSTAVRIYGQNGMIAEVSVQAAGLTSTGDAFVSGTSSGGIDLIVSGEAPRRLPLPSGITQQAAGSVVAVEGARALVYKGDRASWYAGAAVERTFEVDDRSYRADVFPYHWTLASPNFAAVQPDGKVVLSASGPKGMSLIGVRLNVGS